jgi:alpha-D-xyloside xylohydrolase
MKTNSSIHSLTKFLALAASMLLFSSLFYSCQNNPDELTVSIEAGDFPMIEIANPSGEKVTIRPVSASTGSIGFEKDGQTTWVQGRPERRESEEGATLLTWNAGESPAVEMKVEQTGADLDIQLSLTGADAGAPEKWRLNLAAAEGEYFTGVFERVVDGHQNESWKDGIPTAMNLRGEQVEMHLKPTVSAYAPFYISSAGYGFFVSGTWPGVFDFCKTDPGVVQIAFEGPELSCRFYLGKPVLEVVQQHALETGPSFVPPEWVFGPWRWRDEHFNKEQYYDGTEVNAPFNSDLVEDVLMIEAYDIPCTAYWIDRPWGPGQRGFDDYEFDTLRLPQPGKMIEWLNSKNIELMLWIAPFVMGEMADYAEEKGYHLESKPWKNSRQVLMDFTNPETVKWWGEHGPGKLARMGVRGYKLDRADGEKLMDSLHLTTHDGTTYRENFNDYPRQYVKAAYEAVHSVLGDNFVLFPRAQYTGSARYGSMWAGDTNGKPEGLRSAIIGLQRCAVMGYPVWGSDIGGYWGDFSRETTQRWLGFGCFSPIMETGPTNNQGFWNNPQEPHYDPELIATWRLYSKLRMKLVPYIRECAEEARNTGMPIARPLFLLYPEQPEAWEDWQTYQFGPDILVSAIWESGKERHRLYLPAGVEWVDAWDRENVLPGGRYVEVEAPAYKIPVFIRKGAGMDLGDLNALYQESLAIAAEKPDLAELERKEGWREGIQ